MQDRDSQYFSTRHSRRRFIAASAALTLGGVVSPTVFGKAVIAQDGAREFHGAWPYTDLSSGGHFNHFVANGMLNPPNLYGDLMYVPMGMLYWADNSWLPLLAEDWSFIQLGAGGATPAASPVANPESGIDPNADTLQVTLRQGVNWSDGNPVTSRDVVDTFDLLRLMGNTVWSYLSAVEAVDDRTVNFVMSTPSSVVERYVIRRSPMPSVIYGEWAQRARDLVAAGAVFDDSDWQRAIEEFNQFRPEAPIVNGPFNIDAQSVTNAEFSMVRNEDSYWADQVAFDRLVIYNGETDTVSAIVLNEDIDYATHGFPPATQASMRENGIRLISPPTYAGPSLKFNYGALPHFHDKRVRQAIAHVIDRAVIGTVALGEAGVPVQYMAGMADRHVETWAPGIGDQLNPYEVDTDRAAELLEEAGWTRDGDAWLDPDGERASYDIIFPAEQADMSAAGQTIAEQLTAFGIEIIPNAVTFTQIATDVLEGRFHLAVRAWGSSSNPHPHYSYVSAFMTDNPQPAGELNRGIDFPLVQETDVAGEVDLEQLVLDTASGLDVAAQRERVGELALIFNELLDIIPIYEFHGVNPALEGVRVAEWPADDDPILQNSPYADGIPTMLMLTGGLQPVEGGDG